MSSAYEFFKLNWAINEEKLIFNLDERFPTPVVLVNHRSIPDGSSAEMVKHGPGMPEAKGLRVDFEDGSSIASLILGKQFFDLESTFVN